MQPTMASYRSRIIARVLPPALMLAIAAAVSGCWFTSDQPLITEAGAALPIDGDAELVPVKFEDGAFVPDPEGEVRELVRDGWHYLESEVGKEGTRPVAFRNYKQDSRRAIYLVEYQPPGWSYTYGLATTFRRDGKDYAFFAMPSKEQIEAFFAGGRNDPADYPFIRANGDKYEVSSLDGLPDLLEAVLEVSAAEPMLIAFEIRRSARSGEPAAPGVSAPAAPPTAGDWELIEVRDAMTDSIIPIARLVPDRIDAPDGISGPPEILLQLECQDGEPVVYIDWQSYLRRLVPDSSMNLADVMLRFGQGQPRHFVWSMAGSKQVRNTPPDRVGIVRMSVGMSAIVMPDLKTYVVGWTFDQFARALSSTDSMIARAISSGGTRMTASFDTSGGAAAVAHIRKYCG